MRQDNPAQCYRRILTEAGYRVRVYPKDSRGVSYIRFIQLTRLSDGVTQGFSKWSQALQWANEGVLPDNGRVIVVQGHRNTVERRGGRITVVKDTGERSPEFYHLRDAVNWLSAIPY